MSGGGERVTLTIADLYERVTTPNGTEHHYKIYGGSGQIAEVVRRGAGTSEEVTYLQGDHLGSTRLLTDEEGEEIESRDYGVFGEEQPPVDWNSTNIKSGFTGHGHDDSLGLVNMRGRMYDPVVGRFISADPFVANPMSALGWDRYAYVENNPLAFIDPSGFETEIPEEIQFSTALLTAGRAPSPVSASTPVSNPGSRQSQGTARGEGHAPGSGGPGPGQTGHAPGAGMAEPGGPGGGGSPGGAAGPAMGQPANPDPGTRPLTAVSRPPGRSLFDPSRGALAQVAEAPVELPPEEEEVDEEEAEPTLHLRFGMAFPWGEVPEPLFELPPEIEEESPDVPCRERGILERNGVGLLPGQRAAPGMHGHHGLPNEFESIGEDLELDKEDYRIQLDADWHQQIHRRGIVPGLGPGGLWNEGWRVFFKDELSGGRPLSPFSVMNQFATMTTGNGIQYFTPLVIPF